MGKFEKNIFDNDREFFSKLSKKEIEERISSSGDEENAIYNYGIELAKKSEDIEKDLTPSEKEQFEKIKIGAKNVIACFALKKGENLIIITDSGADQLMIRALWEAGRETVGDDCRVIVAPKTEHAAQEFGENVGERIKTADAVLLLTSLSRSHSKESADLMHPESNLDELEAILNSLKLTDRFLNIKEKYSLKEIAEKKDKRKITEESGFASRARLISITNTSREILTEGAALEDPEEMSRRIDKFAEIMKGIEKVRITSENGTELEVDLKVPSLYKENSYIDKPGKLSNFPMGEFAGAVDLNGTSGVYVVDGAVGMIGRVDEPIRIHIKNGIATKIEGGKAAKKLEEILNKAEVEYKEKNPSDKKTSAFRLAEFAFGMNSKAFRYDENGEKISPPTSLEGEKGLGTIHIALGKNSLFNVSKDDPDFNDIPIHIDCVAMHTTIKGIKYSGEETLLIENGEMVCIE